MRRLMLILAGLVLLSISGGLSRTSARKPVSTGRVPAVVTSIAAGPAAVAERGTAAVGAPHGSVARVSTPKTPSAEGCVTPARASSGAGTSASAGSSVASKPASAADPASPSPVAASATTPMTTGSVIHVTTTLQKIGGQGTGGCSLQEAIYSANLHTNMAIESEDVNSANPDHFVTTDCEAGTGNDTIVLPPGAVFSMGNIIDDAHNYMGPTATPIIFSNITIEANGSLLQHTGNLNFRVFSVGNASVDTNPGGTPNVVSGTGSVTIRNAHIKGFSAKGGNGANGGGGGMGAGGAIYVQGGALTVDSCTLDGNSATGGNGGTGIQGGGGGLSGDGGLAGDTAGGGGGGSRGDGGNAFFVSASEDIGGYGGGTFKKAILCGGARDGGDGSCLGGGGGGGTCGSCGGGSSNGGNGNYGGGGGGAGVDLPVAGGKGGFGGGGGASSGAGGNGGRGGFGGGGGAASSSGSPGDGGPFGGSGASTRQGGGGAGLGGAIFNDSATVMIRNSTFTANSVTGGVSQNDDGQGRGGAIFSNNGSLTVVGCTISGNMSTSDVGPQPGGGIVVFGSGGGAHFTLRNTIIANNSGADECFFTGTVTAAGSGNLIIDNFGCPGMVSSSDPQLGPLQNNSPGSTPTMAITTSSPAFDAGDDSVLGSPLFLQTDQRGVTRPQFMHTDIGSYEVVACTGISCPANQTVSNDPNKCGAVVTYPDPTPNGDCGTITCSQAFGTFFKVGTTTVTCLGGGASCSFTVTVNDTQKPAINCANVTAQSANADANCQAVVPDLRALVRAQSSDNCTAQGSLTVTQNPLQGSTVSGAGPHPIVVTVTDASNNSSTCTVPFNVIDNIPPTITCPASFSTAAAASCSIATSKVVTFPNPNANDNCGPPTVVCNPPSGSSFPLGTTTVTCTATDASGNTASCSFTVTVFSFCLQDETNPANFVLVNAVTGDYVFFCNGVQIATGRGVLNVKGCQGSINHTKGDRRAQINWDTSAEGIGAGTAIVQVGVNNTRCQITDKSMNNNTCTATPLVAAPSGKHRNWESRN